MGMEEEKAERQKAFTPYQVNKELFSHARSDAIFMHCLPAYRGFEVTEDVKIKGIVTGNDIGGNIYNEFSVQDATGALLVCVSQGGLFGYLPVGQEVLIDLKGLMLGGYG